MKNHKLKESRENGGEVKQGNLRIDAMTAAGARRENPWRDAPRKPNWSGRAMDKILASAEIRRDRTSLAE